MAHSTGEKKLITIDVSSDTVCPWCFVGKQNLQKAIDSAKDRFNFEVPSLVDKNLLIISISLFLP